MLTKNSGAITADETFGLKITSPELSQKDKGPNANTWAVVMPQMLALLQTGLHTPDSIGKAITEFTQEMLELKLVALTADELEQKKQEAQAQMEQAQAQEAEAKVKEAQAKTGGQPPQFQKKPGVAVPKVGRQPTPEETQDAENKPVKNNA